SGGQHPGHAASRGDLPARLRVAGAARAARSARRAGAGWPRRGPAGRPGLRRWYRFVHALTRHAVYDELSASQRAHLHYQIAKVLERLYASDPEPHLADLAYHHAEALPIGDVAKARTYAVQTGDRAARMLAYEEAARQYERALRIVE